MLTSIIMGASIVGGAGLFIGIFLGYAGKVFEVKVDEREEAINEVLPGNNCGGCGYAGCSGYASAIVSDGAELTACPVGGNELAKKISVIMGVEIDEKNPKTAFVKCGGNNNDAKLEYNYIGAHDCVVAAYLPNGGPKTCRYGCLGHGNCMRACPFGAITMVDGVAKINKLKCKECGKCVTACPKNLIELVPRYAKHLVHCASQDKGKDVMKACAMGCIGCRMCMKVCEFDAITVENNIAYIDPKKCTDCGKCVEKCPKKTIT